MQHRYFLLALATSAIAGILLESCNTAPPAKAHQDFDAAAYLQTQCYSCHNPDVKGDMRLAPPMFAIKKHYYSTYTSEKAFADAIVAYVHEPSEEKTLMPGAIKRFGVMPQIGADTAKVRLLAHYLYNTAMQHPKHGKSEDNKYDDSLLTKAKNIALTTQEALGKTLMNALLNVGAAAAVKVCNVEALPITQFWSDSLNANISRITDKPRNKANTASDKEITIMARMAKALQNQEAIEPFSLEDESNYTAYFPIVTQGMCLQCHGSSQAIKPETNNAIAAFYPQDQAINYNTNELRGLWKIEVKR